MDVLKTDTCPSLPATHGNRLPLYGKLKEMSAAFKEKKCLTVATTRQLNVVLAGGLVNSK